MALYRVILVLLLAWPHSGQAAAREYQLDPVHSRVWFSVDHLGLSRALGTFSAPRGWLRFDPDDFSSARGEIELDLATLDLGDEKWNRRMARGDSLDSEDHPVARWRIERIEPIGEDLFHAHGSLALRGASFPLTLSVRFNGLRRHPLTLRRTAGFSASAVLSRAALGIDKWKSMVGDEVKLEVEVEARRGKRRDATDPAARSAADEEINDGPEE